MHSKSKERKASKGSVQIKNSNGRLQLVFSFGGKRHYLSLGFADTLANRKLAEMKAREIELDMLSGHFEGIEKYKPVSALSTDEAITPISTPKPSLSELWEKFIEYKRPQCSENTMIYMYGVYTSYLKKLPSHDLDHAPQIRDFVLKTFPLESGKRFITRLSACCKWAIKSGMISENPFDGMAAEIKLPKAAKSEGFNDINPFSLEERDAIIEAIATDKFCPAKSGFKHSRYASLIKFLFATGCRPSEAAALKWKNVSRDFRMITFEQVLIRTKSGAKIRNGLKTQERRKFPCNDSLRSLLREIKPEHTQPEDLVFPSPENKAIDINNFRNRTWKAVLKGLGIEYRKLYQTRHTFITHALEVGKLDAKDVARLVGNSPEVIYQHYAGNKRELFVPEF
jgi:integrase